MHEPTSKMENADKLYAWLNQLRWDIILLNKLWVSCYKLLGGYISDNLKWNNHVDYIYKKASKRLHSLRVLYRAGIGKTSILKVYLTIVRPILEYAVPVWQSIPEWLSDKIVSIQQRALNIIFPEADTYWAALHIASVDMLAERRNTICQKYMNKMKSGNHPLNFLLTVKLKKQCNYNLRNEPTVTVYHLGKMVLILNWIAMTFLRKQKAYIVILYTIWKSYQ